MRIALPIWEDRLSPVLDTAPRLLIVDESVPGKRTHFEAHLSEQDVLHRAKLVARLKIDVLICGAISRPFKEMLCAKGVQVISGLSGPIEDIVEAFFDGRLDQMEFLMPGYEHPTPDPMVSKQNQPPSTKKRGGTKSRSSKID